MCTLGIIIASSSAVIQNDFKRLIAYSSISHMGYVLMGLFSKSIYGLVGSVLLMYAHGLVSAGLFISVGVIYRRYGVRQLDYFGGLFLVCQF